MDPAPRFETCDVPKCKSWGKDNGKCLQHSQKLCSERGCTKPKDEFDDKKCTRHKTDDAPSSAEAESPKKITTSKDRYYGGADNEPHVHVYAGGAHLKLGKSRYDLVQGGKRRPGATSAYEALETHPLGDQLRPWVDAALEYFGV